MVPRNNENFECGIVWWGMVFVFLLYHSGREYNSRLDSDEQNFIPGTWYGTVPGMVWDGMVFLVPLWRVWTLR